MTISADYAPNIDLGNGTTRAFAVTFPFADPLDIDVTIFDIGAGADVMPPPALNGGLAYDYTVTGVIDPAGTGVYPNGTVTFNTAPPGNTKVIRCRSTPERQEVVLIDNARFPAKAVEGGLDHLELQIQEIESRVSRAIVAPVSDGPVDMTLPPAAERADTVLTFDDAGNIANPGIAVGPLDAAIAALLAGVSPAGTTAGWARTLATALVLYAAPVVLADGQPMVVDCRASANDGYGGTFAYKAGDAATIFPQSGLGFVDAAGRRWFRIVVDGANNVRWFGAKGDGVADDTAAIDAAEAAASGNGNRLYFPPARTYLYAGSLQPRVDVVAYGATLKQNSAGEIGNNSLGLLYYTGKSNLNVYGGTYDGSFKSTGMGGDNNTNINTYDATFQNCIHGGHFFQGAKFCKVQNCRALDIRYATTVASPCADGFLFGGCTDCSWTDCYAYNMRRIGFVAEENSGGGIKCERIIATRCIADTPVHCDDSTTEYNAGFWAENTNSISWIDCTGLNIASGVGQTSGRVTGMVVCAIGGNAIGTVIARNCRIYGGANRLNVAYLVSGSLQFQTVHIAECYAEKVATGVHTLGGLNSLEIVNLRLNDMVHPNAAAGGIVVDGSGGAIMNKLVIDGFQVRNGAYHPDSGDINIYTATAQTHYVLKHVMGGAYHVMRSPFVSIRIDDCEIAVGSTTYSSFLAAEIWAGSNSEFTLRNNNGAPFSNFAGSPVGATLYLEGCVFDGVTNDFSGTNCNIFCTGTVFKNASRFDLDTTGTFINKFSGITAVGIGALGVIRSNFNAPGGKQTLIVENSHFESATPGNTPVQKFNFDPTKVVLQGNTYNTLVLHNMTATSDVNNVLVA